MSKQTAREELVEEEVAFWRRFIEWWARERDGPVPVRGWEALAAAERKAVGGPGDRDARLETLEPREQHTH